MSPITPIGKLDISRYPHLVSQLDTIKHQNYRIRDTGGYVKTPFLEYPQATEFLTELSSLLAIPVEQLDAVAFSCPDGADTHVDKLDGNRFESITYLIPMILPSSLTTFHVRLESDLNLHVALRPDDLGLVIAFDHTQPHGLEVSDNQSGCVLLMVAVIKEYKT